MAILKTHAWASARHKNKIEQETLKLQAKISQIQEIEQEQGTSPLQEFSRISSSLSVLHFGILGMRLI